MTFTTERRIRFAHVDAAGIVYFPRLLEMVDGAIEDWSRLTFDMGRRESHVGRKLGTPIVSIQARFAAASRLDDILRLDVRVERLGRSSLDLLVAASCEGEARFEARVRSVLTNLSAMKPVAWPDEWRTAIDRGRGA